MKRRRGEKLTAKQGNSIGRTDLSSSLSGVFPLLLIETGFSLVFTDFFTYAHADWREALAVMLSVSILFLLLNGTKIRGIVFPVICAAIIAVSVGFREQLLASGMALINEVIDRLPAVTGRIFERFDTASQSSAAFYLLLLFYALVTTLSVSYGSVFPVFLLMIPVIAGALTGLLETDVSFFLIAAGIFLLIGGGSHLEFKTELSRLLLLLLCAVLVIPAAGVICEKTGDDSKNKAEKKLHDILYDTEFLSMPEGDLRDLGPLQSSETPALRVSMEKPQKVYLKGQAYDVYTGTSWETIDNSRLAESESLFYWLHRNGFYSQSQISFLSSVAGEDESFLMAVENAGACKGHAYLPYAFASSSVLDEKVIGDLTTDSSITEFSVLPGSLPEWIRLQHILTQNQAVQEYSVYRNMEEAYRNFVEEYDLALTEDSWNVLRRQLGETGEKNSLSDIYKKINEYLSENIYYDEKCTVLNGSADFLHWVLEKTGAGYSVHYATAATLMLRYMGVPARYVEGYLLTADEAAMYSPGDEIILTEKNAHAWTEIYLTGVGFVPLEFTPGYIDLNDFPKNEQEKGRGTSMEGFTYDQNPLMYAESAPPDSRETIVEKKEDSASESLKWLSFGALLLLALILLAALLYVIIRRQKLRRFIKKAEQSDGKTSVCLFYPYAEEIIKRSSLPDKLKEKYKVSGEIYNRALFSKMEITENDKAAVMEFAKDVLENAVSKWSFREKINYRLIDVIY